MNERLMGTEAPEVIERHVARYEKAVRLASELVQRDKLKHMETE